MKAGHKFLVGAGIIVASVALLITQGVRETGVYFLTPTELAAKTSSDPSFYDVGLKMGAKVVPGSIRRDPSNRQIDFEVSDGARSSPVTYRGLGRDGVFRATEVLAKCGSRYEAAAEGKQA